MSNRFRNWLVSEKERYMRHPIFWTIILIWSCSDLFFSWREIIRMKKEDSSTEEK